MKTKKISNGVYGQCSFCKKEKQIIKTFKHSKLINGSLTKYGRIKTTRWCQDCIYRFEKQEEEAVQRELNYFKNQAEKAGIDTSGWIENQTKKENTDCLCNNWNQNNEMAGCEGDIIQDCDCPECTTKKEGN